MWDLFDPKPALTKYNGSPYQGKVKVGSNNRPIGYLMQSPFEFKKHGQSGLEISSVYPHLSRFADDLCVIRSLYTDTAAHASGNIQMNTGNVIIGRPSLGLLAQLRSGHSGQRPAQLRGHDRSPRRTHRRVLQLDRRFHAGRVSGEPYSGARVVRS